MSEYTPTTNQVRQAWMLCRVPRIGSNYGGTGLKPEFDRWLDAHDRQIAAKAWDEGHEQGYDSGRYAEDYDEPETVETRSQAANPYRAASIASGEVESRG